MGQEREDSGGEEILCDWCGDDEAQGAFFVPGKGVLNLCGHCRMLIMAIIIDIA